MNYNSIFKFLIFIISVSFQCWGSESEGRVSEIDLDQRYFSRKVPVFDPKKPFTYEDFLHHGMLVHVGALAPEMYDFNANLLTTLQIESRDRICTYWSLNGPISSPLFYRQSNCVVLKRFTPCLLERCINLNPYEVMIPGPVLLEAGDVIIAFGKYHYQRLHPHEENGREENPDSMPNVHKFYQAMSAKLQGTGVQLVLGPYQYDADGDELNAEDNLAREGYAQVRDCVYQILKEIGCWQIDLPQGFWTHNPEFKFRGSSHVPPYPQFAKALFSRHPKMSVGYELYSSLGDAGLVNSFEDIYASPNRFLYYKGILNRIDQNLMNIVEEFYTTKLHKLLDSKAFAKVERLIEKSKKYDLTDIHKESLEEIDAAINDIDEPYYGIHFLALAMSLDTFNDFYRNVLPSFEGKNIIHDLYMFTRAYRHQFPDDNLTDLREKTRFLPFKIRQAIFMTATGYDIVHKGFATSDEVNTLWGWE